MVAALVIAKHGEAEEHCNEDLGNLGLQERAVPA
jgi:hypothetical protein